MFYLNSRDIIRYDTFKRIESYENRDANSENNLITWSWKKIKVQNLNYKI